MDIGGADIRGYPRIAYWAQTGPLRSSPSLSLQSAARRAARRATAAVTALSRAATCAASYSASFALTASAPKASTSSSTPTYQQPCTPFLSPSVRRHWPWTAYSSEFERACWRILPRSTSSNASMSTHLPRRQYAGGEARWAWAKRWRQGSVPVSPDLFDGDDVGWARQRLLSKRGRRRGRR